MFKDLLKKRRPLHIPGDAELRNLSSSDPALAALYLEEAMSDKRPVWPLHLAHWLALGAFFLCAWGTSYVSAFPYLYFGPSALAAFLLLCLSYSKVPFRQGLKKPATVLAIATVSLASYVGAFLLAYAHMSPLLESEKRAYLSASAEISATVHWSFRDPVFQVTTAAYSYASPDGRHFWFWRSGPSRCGLKFLAVRYAVAKPEIHETFATAYDCRDVYQPVP